MEDMETDLKVVGHQMVLLPRKNATVLKYMCDCPRSQRHDLTTANRSSRPRRIYAYLQQDGQHDEHNYPYYVTPSDQQNQLEGDHNVFVLSSSSTDSNPAELKLIHLDMHGNLQEVHGTHDQQNRDASVRLTLCNGQSGSIAEELQRLQLESDMLQCCCPVIVCEHVDDADEMSDAQAEIDFRQGQARIATLKRLTVPSVDIEDERRRPPLPDSEDLVKTWWRR